jgi:hypothetical protein
MPSASNIQRAIICPASVILPQQKGTNERAEYGTIIHDYLAGIYDGQEPEDAVTYILEKYGKPGAEALKEFNLKVDFDELPKLENPIPEYAFAYDPKTGEGRELGRMMGRDYSAATKTEFPGTTDLVGICPEDGVLEVWDWKTGLTEVPAPAWNWQLRHAALAINKTFAPERMRIGIIHLSDGVVKESYEVKQSDLVKWREELTALQGVLLEAIELGSVPAVKTGPHCKYCPAWNNCPAQTGLIKKLAHGPAQFFEEVNSLLTPETVGLAANRYLQVKELMRNMEGAFRSWVAENGAIKLGGGQVLGKVMVGRKELDGSVTFDVLAEKYGDAVAKKACDFSTSQAAVKRALDDVKFERGMKGKSIDAIFEQVKERGGLVVKEREEFRVHYEKGE